MHFKNMKSSKLWLRIEGTDGPLHWISSATWKDYQRTNLPTVSPIARVWVWGKRRTQAARAKPIQGSHKASPHLCPPKPPLIKMVIAVPPTSRVLWFSIGLSHKLSNTYTPIKWNKATVHINMRYHHSHLRNEGIVAKRRDLIICPQSCCR
jgi:hypothetical protein